MVGVRGSAAASAVLYCLNITDIEPLTYDLVFERFLNLERKEMPDIDLDIEDARRDEVIDYVTRRFGQDRVAQIITFGTFGARAGIRDVGRALGMSFNEVDQVARLLPAGAHPSSLGDSLERLPQFRDVYDRDEQVKKLVDMAMKLEGVSRNASTHAAGIVISREPLVNVVPLQRPVKSAGSDDDGVPMTQWDMNRVAEAGLLKLDLLGLTNLTTLARTRDLIAERHGKRIDIDKIPLDDKATFDLLCEGKTMGLFQLEGQGMTRWIKQLQPRTLNEVSAMIALYRPGPMEHIHDLSTARGADFRHVPAQRSGRHPEGDVWRHCLPGPGVADRAEIRRLHAWTGGHCAQGDGQEGQGDHGGGGTGLPQRVAGTGLLTT